MKNNLMDSSLDKLRNKEYSTGLVVQGHIEGEGEKQLMYLGYRVKDEYTIINYFKRLDCDDTIRFDDDCDWEYIGHPLTRGRIQWLYASMRYSPDGNKLRRTETMGKLEILVDRHIELYDQNELQRMENKEVREKLQPLLKQFSDYL